MEKGMTEGMFNIKNITMKNILMQHNYVQWIHI